MALILPIPGKYGTDAAFDVHPAICTGGAGFGGDVIECLFFVQQVLGQCFEHIGAVMDGHLPQRRAALVTSMVHACQRNRVPGCLHDQSIHR